MHIISNHNSSAADVLAACVQQRSIDDVVRMVPWRCTIIVPTSTYRRAIVRSWAKLRPGEVMPDVLTMHRYVLRSARTSLPMATDAEAQAVLDRALQDANERFRPPGLTIQNLLRWKQELLSPQALVGVQHPDADQLHRIARIWAAYEARMQGVALDRGDLGAGEIPVDDQPILVLATHGLSAADEQMLLSLAERGATIAIQFVSATLSQRDRSLEVAQRLTARGWHPIDDDTSEHLRPSHPVHLWTAPTPRDEVRTIIGAVKVLAASATPLDSIAIVLPSSSVYTTLLETEAEQAGLPLNIDVLTPLAAAPDTAAIYAACRVVIDQWDRSDIARLAHVCPIVDGVDISMLPSAATQYRIDGGQGAHFWRDRLQRRVAMLETLESADSPDTDAIRAERMRALAALRAVQKLSGLLSVPDRLMKASDVVRYIGEVAVHLGIQLRDDVRETLLAFTTFCDRHEAAPAPFHEQLSRWWMFVQAEQRVVHPARPDGVAVITAADARLRAWDVVFAPGFIHGIRPRQNNDLVDVEVLGALQRVRDDEDVSDILRSARSIVAMSRPMTVDDDDALASVYWEMMDEARVGNPTSHDPHHVVRVLADVQSQRMLLHRGELQAYQSGAGYHRELVQKGLQPDQLESSARERLLDVCARPLSPSRIDLAASCGYRYYAEQILRAQFPELIDDMLTSMERGTLMHAVAHRLFSSLQTSPLPEDSWTIQDIRAAMVDLRSCTMDALVQKCVEIFHEERLRFPDEYLYREAEDQAFLDYNERPGILRRWLQLEYDLVHNHEQDSTPFYPIAFEVSIEDDVVLADGRTERVRLRIDRVDARVIAQGGSDTVEVRVVDYKTSTEPVGMEMREGRVSQMPIYMIALEQWFARHDLAVQVVEASYHVFGRSVLSSKGPKAVRAVTTDESQLTKRSYPVLQSDVAPLVTQGIDTIREHRFGVAPSAKACNTCRMHELCRVDDWGHV